MEEDKTILIVDDTKENIDILFSILENYDLLAALDGERALQLLETEKADLILMDIMMPGIDGYETCRRLKSSEKTADIPVIFSTVISDENSIEKAFECGGVDYITKPYKPKEILARVKTHLKMRSLISYLDNLSSYDQMTGLLNRRKFFELSQNLFNRVKQNLYGVILDIDKFKKINDTYGHPTGDQVIKAVSREISGNLDKEAILGRIGGEEFAVLFEASSGDQAFVIIEKVRNAVEALNIVIESGPHLKVTISAGIAGLDKSHKSLDSLLKDADKALYDSKGTGRNKSIFRG